MSTKCIYKHDDLVTFSSGIIAMYFKGILVKKSKGEMSTTMTFANIVNQP